MWFFCWEQQMSGSINASVNGEGKFVFRFLTFYGNYIYILAYSMTTFPKDLEIVLRRMSTGDL